MLKLASSAFYPFFRLGIWLYLEKRCFGHFIVSAKTCLGCWQGTRSHCPVGWLWL